MKQPQIVWLGGIFSDEACLRSRALPPAAKKWQRGIVKGLEHAGADVFCIGHKLEPAWPKGDLFPGKSDELDAAFKSSLVRYINLPVFRHVNLAWAYTRCIKKHIRKHGKPIAVLSYNHAWFIAKTLSGLKDRLQNIPIILDRTDPSVDLRDLSRELRNVSKVVYLSHWAYTHSPKTPCFLLDGGVHPDEIVPRQHYDDYTEPHTVLYSGMMTRWGGVMELIEAFKQIKKPELRLWLCGHGPEDLIKNAIQSDERITFFGLVSEGKLHELCQNTSIFMNPRPTKQNGNKMNFPSKLYQYMRYLKPIISTMTPGVAPDYANVLFVIDKETPEGIGEVIRMVDELTPEERDQYAHRLDKWLRTKGCWDVKCSELIEWIET